MILAIIQQRIARHPTDLDQNMQSKVVMGQVQGLIIQKTKVAHKKDTQSKNDECLVQLLMYLAPDNIQLILASH